jgi:hypothetical protein
MRTRVFAVAIAAAIVAAIAVPAAGASGSDPMVEKPILEKLGRIARAAEVDKFTTWTSVRMPEPSEASAQAVVSRTIPDASGDVDDDRSDIVSSGSGANSSSFLVTVTVDNPTNPLTDDNWEGDTGPFWGLDTNFDGETDYLIFLFRDGAVMRTGLFDENVTELICTGSPNYDGTSYRASFGSGCPRMRSYQWGSAMTYDTLPDDQTNDPFFDFSPETGWASATPTPRTGYWMLGGDGKTYAFGHGPQFSTRVPFAAAMATRPDGTGIWIADLAGHVYTKGRARYMGGTPALPSGEYVSTMSATPDAGGYWLFTNRGRVFRFGNAKNYGDLSGRNLNAPIIASVSTPNGKGYYMVGADGGIFTFGNANFHGSMGGKPLNGRIVGIAPDRDGTGYWLVGSDGGVFAFKAPFRGSMGGKKLNQPINGMVAYGNGYLMVASDGGVFNFSNKAFLGSMGGKSLTAPIIGIVAFAT